jgi:hypothetical protein
MCGLFLLWRLCGFASLKLPTLGPRACHEAELPLQVHPPRVGVPLTWPRAQHRGLSFLGDVDAQSADSRGQGRDWKILTTPWPHSSHSNVR